MKRLLLCLLVVIMMPLSCFSLVSQKIYPVGSPVFEGISDIYLVTGHAMPSSSGPWSAAELLEMIQAVPREEVPTFLQRSYDSIIRELDDSLSIELGHISMQFNASATLELYYHTNTDGQTRTDINSVTEKSFTGVQGWAFDMIHSSPLFQIDFQFDVSDSFYVYLGLPIKSGFHAGSGYKTEVGATHFGSNIPGLKTIGSESSISLDPNWPYRAFASFGGKAWTVQIGRDRLSWGLGKTGNLGISDNLPFHDMLRFAAFSKSFKYSFLISSFPHKVNYYDPYRGSDIRGNVEKDPIQGINLYLAHRIEGRFFKDRFSLSLTEAIMYASADATIDPRIFNPATIFHNFYDPSDANSTLVVEMDFTPVKCLNIYGQFILDDLAIPGGESAGGPTSSGYPNAMGYLAGARYAMEAWNGLLTFNLEGAYIDPYTYVRYNADPNNPSSEAYGLDYIVSTRTYVTGTGSEDCLVYDEYFLGYKNGNDCAVANLNVGWKKPDVIAVSANCFFMAHGTHDKWTRWDNIGNHGEQQWNQASVTPTSTHETGNYRYDVSDRNAVCYTLDIGLGCSWFVNDSLKLFAQADFICLWNSLNRQGINEQDFQLVMGAKYSL